MLKSEAPPNPNKLSVEDSARPFAKGWVWAELLLAGFFCLLSLFAKTALPLILGANLLFLFSQLATSLLLKFELPVWQRRLHVFGIGLILVGSLLGLAGTLDSGLAFGIWGRLLAGLSLFLALQHWLNSSQPSSLARLKMLAVVLSVGGAGLAVLGLFSLHFNNKLFNLSLYDHLPQLNLLGGFNSNLLAGAVVVLLPLPIGLALGAKNWLWRIAIMLPALIMLGVLLLTQSRTAWLAAAVALGFWILLGLAQLLPFGDGGLRRIIAALVVAIGFGAIELVAAFSNNPTLKALNGRAGVWDADLKLLGQFPLTGIGFGSFPTTAPYFFPYFLSNVAGTPNGRLYSAYTDHVFNNHAHNLFFQTWLDLGILGFAGLVLWLSWLGWLGVNFLLKTPLNRQSALGYAFLVGLVAFGVQSLFDASLWTDRGGITDWTVLSGLTVLPIFYQRTPPLMASTVQPAVKKRNNRFVTILVMGALVISTLFVLKWGSIISSAQRNLGNWELEKTALYCTGLNADDYRSNFETYLIKFYNQCYEPQSGRPELAQALSWYKAAVATDSSDVVAWRLKGRAEALQNDVDTAEQSYLQAIQLAPNDPYANFEAGLLRYNQGDYEGAISFWKQSQGSDLYLLALTWVEKYETKNLTAATRDLKLLLQLNPSAAAYQP